MNRHVRQLRCKHHSRSREWAALSFEQRATIAQSNFRAGLRQVRCRCGEYVWAWELVHEELVASGLRWECGYVLEWLLTRRGAVVGSLTRWDGVWEVRWYYRQKGRVVGYRVVHTGTLADCARALVRAVT